MQMEPKKKNMFPVDHDWCSAFYGKPATSLVYLQTGQSLWQPHHRTDWIMDSFTDETEITW